MRIFITIFALLLSILLTSLSMSHTSHAKDITGVTISPLRQEGKVDPGSVFSGSLFIKNSGDQTQRIDLSAETFNVTNQAYDYLFVPDTTESRWVSFDKTSLTLKKGKSANISYNVSVPIGAEPAGYYLALFALNRPAGSSVGGITPTERVASLLYLDVAGDSTRSGKLVQLRSPLVAFNEASWSATLQNSGTLHYRSIYSATITSIFNHELTSHEDSRLILPGSVRLIEDPLNLPDLLGLYKINYSVSLGDAPAHKETRWFFYLPPLQLLLISLIIAGLVVIFKKPKVKASKSAERQYKARR